ncbi:hypothetical protein H4R18_005674 [Coemansia javaensis]|uniref:Spindle pole body component n=1 Tax=Coemansia javaensis TaxID=2761396 RepID=A0A9W8H2G2_9FUNG|nr:hypothetical protein H4R18_005674 [Coemansia javaensis]
MSGAELDRTLLEYADAFLGAVAAGDQDEAERRDGLMRFFHTIIGSNLAPAVARDEEALVGELQKRTMARRGDMRAALRVARLYGTLKQQDPAYDWWPVLYFLSECCARPLPPPAVAAATAAAAAAGAGGYGDQPLRPRGVTSAALRPSMQSLRHEPGAHARPATADSSPFAMSAATMGGGPGNSSAASLGAQLRHHHQHRAEPAAEAPASRQSRRSGSAADDAAGVFLHRELPTYDDVGEAELLHDLIYVMQGIDGTYVRWNRAASAYAVRADVRLSRPTRAMVGLVAELGVLARDIQDYTDAVDRQGRLFEQSFCTEIKGEMAEYYRLVADMEARLFKAPRALRPGESQMGATLRRMHCWTAEARQRLRLLATAIGKVQDGRGGGAVLSAISTLVEDGDPFVQAFAQRLLKTASAPFNSILVSWVTDGELVDPYGEFFIQERADRHDMLWGERYTVAPDMIPVHINGEMTRRIFQIGRSLNFLRVACDDAQWVAERGPRTLLAGDIADVGDLDTFVCRSAALVNGRLMSVLRERFDLMGHVGAIRRYLLFEKGDFALALMEVLDNQDDHAGKRIMAHDLSAVLSSAVRSANVQHERADRLAALALVFAAADDDAEQHGRGWDDVSLSYNLSPPLSYVVPRPTMRKYMDVSRFLLKLKRAEYALHLIWHQQMTGSRSQLRSEELQQRRRLGSAGEASAAAAAADAESPAVRKAMREGTIACTEMIQFFQQVQRYISLNVIEGAWARFAKATTTTRDDGGGDTGDLGIDAWNAAHSKYVASVHDVVCGARGFQHSLDSVLGTASQFITVMKELYSERTLGARRAASPAAPRTRQSLSMADRLQQLRANVRLHGSGSPPPAADPAAEHAARVHSTVARFRSQVREILGAMSRATMGELPFLVVTLNFNEAYTTTTTTT